jgi:2'-5' RNA ligase
MANWFVGIPIPAGRWFAALVADAPPAVRLLHPDDLHITVAFLGRASEDRAMAAWNELSDLSARSIEASLGKLEAFGSPRRPSALSVVLERGAAEVSALIASLRGPMISAAEARPDDRPPRPHLTVARPLRSASAEQRKKAVAWAAGKAPVAEVVLLDRLRLYTWSEDRRQRQFRAVAEHMLEP